MDAPAFKKFELELMGFAGEAESSIETRSIRTPGLPDIVCVAVLNCNENDEQDFSYKLIWADRKNTPLFYTCEAVVYTHDENCEKVIVWTDSKSNANGAPVSSAVVAPKGSGTSSAICEDITFKLEIEFDLYKSRKTRAASPTSKADLANLEEGTFCDVVVAIGDKTFNCHKVILASRSEVFKSMLTRPFKEAKENKIELKDVTEDVADVFIRSVYANELVAESSVTWALFEAAKMYDLPNLTRSCFDALAKNVDIGNSCETLFHAHKHGLNHLFDYTLKFVKRNKAEVAATDGWNGLTRNDDFLQRVILAALE